MYGVEISLDEVVWRWRKMEEEPTAGVDQLLSLGGRIMEDDYISLCFPCFCLNTHFFNHLGRKCHHLGLTCAPITISRPLWWRIGSSYPGLHSHGVIQFEQQAKDIVVGAFSISTWILKALLLANIFLSSSNNQMKHFAFWALIFQASNFLGPWPPGLIRSVQSCFMLEKNSAVAV